jgi:GNAT superfamily N-acetyltransferase
MSTSQLLIEPQLANQCEDAEALHIWRQGQVCAQLYPDQDIVFRPVPNGGIVIRTLPALTGKLNRAVGCGKDGELGKSTLMELESLFSAIGLAPEIHLSPFAKPSTLQALIEHGYEEQGVLSTHWCPLENSADESTPIDLSGTGAVETRVVAAHDTEDFIEASIAGFQSNGRSRELLGALARIATRRTDTQLFVALVDNEIAGSAALASIETSEGSVAHLYLDSTLPGFRCRGVQQALIQARLHEARCRGLSLATTITRVGDGSARNVERAGLRIAYTTAILTRPELRKGDETRNTSRTQEEGEERVQE